MLKRSAILEAFTKTFFLSISESYPEVTRLTEPVMDHHTVIDIPDRIEKGIQSHTFPKISSGLIDFLFRCSAIACGFSSFGPSRITEHERSVTIIVRPFISSRSDKVTYTFLEFHKTIIFPFHK